MSADKAEKKVYQFVDNLVRLGKQELVDALALQPDLAEEIMTSIAHSMILESARFHIYVPVAIELRLSPRNVAIWAEYGQPGPDDARPYTPARLEQLAEKHDLTTRQIYKIVGLMRAREMAERQPELTGLDATA